MTDARDQTTKDRDATGEVPHDEWPQWCDEITSDNAGRRVALLQSDRALGDVRLAEGEPLVALEHDKFGKMESLTFKCGSQEVPVSYVVAEPRSVVQQRDRSGDLVEVRVADATGRRLQVNFF